MIATALALQEVTKHALYNDEVVDSAGELLMDYKELSLDEFSSRLYHYSALISTLATTLATTVLLSEEQQDELIATIEDIDAMSALVFDNPFEEQ